MAAKKQSPMDFILAQLRKNKDVSYADVHAAAQKKNLKIYPIMYGRAKAMLGLVPVAPRGSGQYAKKKRAAKKATARAAARGTRGGGGGGGTPESLDSLITHIREAEREREHLKRALEKIKAIVADM